MSEVPEYAFIAPSAGSTAAFVAVITLVALSFVALVARAYRDTALGARRAGTRAAAGVALWMLLTGGFVATGIPRAEPLALIPLFVAINISAVVFAFTRVGKQLATELPLVWLVGFHAFRFPLEVVLHSFAEQGSLPPQMTWTGHNLDIASGILAALVLGYALVRRAAVPSWVALAFNALGSTLLLSVIVIVVLSSPTPIKAYEGPPILLAAYLPYFFVASVAVCFAVAMHLVLWRRLVSRRAASVPPGTSLPVQALHQDVERPA